VKVEEVIPVPWWEQTFLGIPFWAWILLAGGALAAAGLAYESERRRRLEMALLAAK